MKRVYPFYIESNVPGRETPISGGCKSKDGYQQTQIYQREKGEIITAFKIEQVSILDTNTGKRTLVCSVYDRRGRCVATEETEY